MGNGKFTFFTSRDSNVQNSPLYVDSGFFTSPNSSSSTIAEYKVQTNGEKKEISPGKFTILYATANNKAVRIDILIEEAPEGESGDIGMQDGEEGEDNGYLLSINNESCVFSKNDQSLGCTAYPQQRNSFLIGTWQAQSLGGQSVSWTETFTFQTNGIMIQDEQSPSNPCIYTYNWFSDNNALIIKYASISCSTNNPPDIVASIPFGIDGNNITVIGWDGASRVDVWTKL